MYHLYYLLSYFTSPSLRCCKNTCITFCSAFFLLQCFMQVEILGLKYLRWCSAWPPASSLFVFITVSSSSPSYAAMGLLSLWAKLHLRWVVSACSLGILMQINYFPWPKQSIFVCSWMFLAFSWPWGEEKEKEREREGKKSPPQWTYTLNLIAEWGVSPASSDQWRVNSPHFLFHSAVLIFSSASASLSPASRVFQPLGLCWLP